MRWTRTAVPAVAALALLLPGAAVGGTPAVAGTAGGTLSAGDVKLIIARAVTRAHQLGLAAAVAVTDREGNVLGAFQMTGAAPEATVTVPNGVADPDGLEGTTLPLAAAAVSKAGTAAFLSSAGNAYSTRTMGFIIQENFPPTVSSQPAGPLFGVQFSQLPCSDAVANPLPLGLSADPGGVPIYRNGLVAGGLGVEMDGFYSVGSPMEAAEEDVAVAAQTPDYAAPATIRPASLPFVTAAATTVDPLPFADLPGTLAVPVRDTPAARQTAATLGGRAGRADPRFYPARDGAAGLTAADVEKILTQAVERASVTRSAIRVPAGQPVEVNVAVTDAGGAVLGVFSTIDAPEFGFDVSVQKARSAAFFSGPGAGASLRAAGPAIAAYADAAQADGLPLDGTIAFSGRSLAAVSRPFFPDGVDGTANGPFSKPIGVWSPFNTGLQLALARQSIVDGASDACTAVPGLRNGMQPLAGGLPLYRDGRLVGAIGVSGDGIEEDEFVAAAGAAGFAAPEPIRADQFLVRGVHLPY